MKIFNVVHPEKNMHEYQGSSAAQAAIYQGTRGLTDSAPRPAGMLRAHTGRISEAVAHMDIVANRLSGLVDQLIGSSPANEAMDKSQIAPGMPPLSMSLEQLLARAEHVQAKLETVADRLDSAV